MSWQPPVSLAARMASAPIQGLARTWHIRLFHEDRWRRLIDERRPFVFLLWHEMLLPLLWHHRRQGIAIVVSAARDGQYLAAFAERLGYRNLFGSSSKGGARVLLQAVRTLEAGGTVAFTPDGPRGPRREIKPGIIHAAQKGQAAVLPIAAVASRAWRLRSWDRFVCPKPFATVRIGYGEPYLVAPGRAGLEQATARAKTSLGLLERELAWQDAEATGTD